MEPNYVYRCTVTRVVDGDTVDADIDLGFKIIYKERIRLMGIDTPESRTRNLRKFGRILGTLWIGDMNVNDQLVAEGHARPYFGGSKGELGEWTREVDGEWQRWTAYGYVAYDSPRTLLEVFSNE